MQRLNFESLYIDVEIKEVNGKEIQLLSFNGKFNHQNSYTISKALQDIFVCEIYDLLLDLSDLKYINSVGLAIILSMVKVVEQHSGKFVIGGVNKSIQTIIQLVELPDKVIITQSLADGLKEFS